MSAAALRVVYAGSDGRASVAISSLDFDVGPQETLGILGESGSGKSSLAHALLRLLPGNAKFSADRLCFQNDDLLRFSQTELRRLRGAGIALISQEPALALNPVLTVGRQIEDVLAAHSSRSRDQRKQSVKSILRDVGLEDTARMMRAYPHQLSGGQRQRAAIAQALVCSPSLLIADEPLSALDVSTQAEVLELLKRVKQERRLAMIFITHNAAVLEGLADRIMVMRQGEVVAMGRFGEISASDDPYVANLISPQKTLAQLAAPAAITASGEPLLQVRGLSKKFVQSRPFSRKSFTITALEDVSFEVAECQSIAIIGRSGSGKSTLARCLAGLEEADSGEIVANRTNGKNNVQMIFQEAGTALNPRFTAEEIIAEPLLIAGKLTPEQRMERVSAVMDDVGFNPEWAGRRAEQFSGGQKQRLALARALVAEPRVLILDEAFSGLDVPAQARMMRLVLELQSRHKLACIHVSHDLNFVSLFAREVLVMDAGRIVERTSPSRLPESQNPVTRAIIEQSESLHAIGLEAVL